jgi:multidrug efflux pump subunit AcrA (membrane-fusion protein)
MDISIKEQWMGKTKRCLKWILIGLIPLIAAGVFFYLYAGDYRPSEQGPQYFTYTVQAVTQRNVVEVSGNIEPLEEEDIGFLSSGEVSAVYVKEGDHVKAGTLLAELDDSEQVYNLAVLENNIEKAKISGSKGELKLLELERDSKLMALKKRKLYTPISGYVTEVDITVGEYTISQNEINTVIRVINTSSMKAEVEIDELDVPQVKIGQKVTFFFDALPEREIIGRVSFLPVEARLTSEGIAVLDAEVMIDDPPQELVPGYSFSAEIIIDDESKVLVLDKEAIFERNGKSMVLHSKGTTEAPTLREVKTAAFGEGKVRVLSGLQEGDIVISASTQTDTENKPRSGTSPIQLLGLPPRPGSGPPGGRP